MVLPHLFGKKEKMNNTKFCKFKLVLATPYVNLK